METGFFTLPFHLFITQIISKRRATNLLKRMTCQITVNKVMKILQFILFESNIMSKVLFFILYFVLRNPNLDMFTNH